MTAPNGNWHVYQTPWGDWAYFCLGVISDGYATEIEALRAALDQATGEVNMRLIGIGIQHESDTSLNRVEEKP